MIKAINIQSLKSARTVHIPNDIKELLNKNTWLAGGALRSLLDNKKPNDFDLFFKTPASAAYAEYSIDAMGYKKVFECLLGLLTTFKKNDIKVQVIKKQWYSDITDCINSFDFTVTCAGIDDEYLYLHKNFIKDTRKKIIKIHRLTYPTASINRLFKYKNYGFYIGDAIKDIIEKVSLHDKNIIDMTELYID